MSKTSCAARCSRGSVQGVLRAPAEGEGGVAHHENLSAAAAADSLEATADYSLGVQALQRLAAEICCQTLEHFSECMFAELEGLYGPLPMHLWLRKCDPPIHGFMGTVSLERWRRKPF